jgi:hypothetical protein
VEENNGIYIRSPKSFERIRLAPVCLLKKYRKAAEKCKQDFIGPIFAVKSTSSGRFKADCKETKENLLSLYHQGN